MNKEQFVEKYKAHFDNSYHTHMHQVWVHDEWLDYIDAALQSVLAWKSGGESVYGDFQIHQIKEKFGGLRFYYHAETEETDRVINGAIMAMEGILSLVTERSKEEHPAQIGMGGADGSANTQAN